MKKFDILNTVLTPLAYLATIIVAFITLLAINALVFTPIIEWFNN